MTTTLIVLAVVVVVLGLVIATRPAKFHVERSATIGAPRAEVFGYVNDLRRWTSWSPWENLDPNLKRNYSGSATGKGAVYDWAGNKKAGIGRMTIVDVVPNERIEIDLHFEKPIHADNTCVFTFQPAGNNTHVTWKIYGPNTLMGKVMTLFGGMEKFIGKDFDRGLGNLAAVAQSDADGRAIRKVRT